VLAQAVHAVGVGPVDRVSLLVLTASCKITKEWGLNAVWDRLQSLFPQVMGKPPKLNKHQSQDQRNSNTRYLGVQTSNPKGVWTKVGAILRDSEGRLSVVITGHPYCHVHRGNTCTLVAPKDDGAGRDTTELVVYKWTLHTHLRGRAPPKQSSRQPNFRSTASVQTAHVRGCDDPARTVESVEDAIVPVLTHGVGGKPGLAAPKIIHLGARPRKFRGIVNSMDLNICYVASALQLLAVMGPVRILSWENVKAPWPNIPSIENLVLKCIRQLTDYPLADTPLDITELCNACQRAELLVIGQHMSVVIFIQGLLQKCAKLRAMVVGPVGEADPLARDGETWAAVSRGHGGERSLGRLVKPAHGATSAPSPPRTVVGEANLLRHGWSVSAAVLHTEPPGHFAVVVMDDQGATLINDAKVSRLTPEAQHDLLGTVVLMYMTRKSTEYELEPAHVEPANNTGTGRVGELKWGQGGVRTTKGQPRRANRHWLRFLSSPTKRRPPRRSPWKNTVLFPLSSAPLMLLSILGPGLARLRRNGQHMRRRVKRGMAPSLIS
jgi:hypothetical protein